ncbi:MAG TPA: pantoate--beta-alanine ligase [Mariprofundaceae bacterium]|nr:pantoate--beta-alanine ligase [Mariprofundaceae bacterium]
MKTIETVSGLRRELQARRNGNRVALVPTMGCLHEGHMSLIRLARELADVVVVSIYVNPLQFGPSEDFSAYPRPFADDERACLEAGVDLLFHPQNLYPEGGPQVSLHVAGLDDVLCGATRPGHFDGVATVVAILFNIVQPDVAVFGEKDWQQLAIIRRMASDLAMPVAVIGATIVREPDGLAMSSRNRYLGEEERQQAAGLFRALQAMHTAAQAGEESLELLLDIGRDSLKEDGIEPEYLEIRDAETLQEPKPGRAARAFVAARIGTARLIDNMALDGLE